MDPKTAKLAEDFQKRHDVQNVTDGRQLSMDAYMGQKRKKRRSTYSAARHVILKNLNAFYSGLTIDELCKRTSLPVQTVSARCADMRQELLITYQKDGAGKIEKRETSTGTPAGVNVITKSGIREFLRLETIKVNETQNPEPAD